MKKRSKYKRKYKVPSLRGVPLYHCQRYDMVHEATTQFYNHDMALGERIGIQLDKAYKLGKRMATSYWKAMFKKKIEIEIYGVLSHFSCDAYDGNETELMYDLKAREKWIENYIKEHIK